MAGVMNFVVLSAALSSANANLYLISRTLFSLSRAGYVPRALGAVNRRNTPVNALLASGIGLGASVLVEIAIAVDGEIFAGRARARDILPCCVSAYIDAASNALAVRNLRNSSSPKEQAA